MKKITFLLIFVCSFSFAQVGIGTTNPTGALDVSSNLPSPSLNKAGFVPPTVALSATNSIVTTTPTVSVVNPATNLAPVNGTLVYNTNTSAAGVNQVTPGYYYYNGTTWEKFSTDKKLITINQSTYITLYDEQAYNLGSGGWLVDNFSSVGPLNKIYASTSGSGLYYCTANTTLTNLNLNGYLLNPNSNNVTVTIYIMKYSLGTVFSDYTTTITGTVLASLPFSLSNGDTNQYPVNINIPQVNVLAGDVITCWIYRSLPNNAQARTVTFGGQLQFNQ